MTTLTIYFSHSIKSNGISALSFAKAASLSSALANAKAISFEMPKFIDIDFNNYQGKKYEGVTASIEFKSVSDAIAVKQALMDDLNRNRIFKGYELEIAA